MHSIKERDVRMLKVVKEIRAEESVAKLDLLHIDTTHPDNGCCCGGHDGHKCCGRHRHAQEGPASAPNTAEVME